MPEESALKISLLGSLAERFERDFMSESLQSAHQMAREMFLAESIQVMGTEICVMASVLQQMIDNHQKRVRYRHQRTFSTPPPGQTMILRGQVALLSVAGSPSRLHQGGPQPDILSNLVYTGALLIQTLPRVEGETNLAVGSDARIAELRRIFSLRSRSVPSPPTNAG